MKAIKNDDWKERVMTNKILRTAALAMLLVALPIGSQLAAQGAPNLTVTGFGAPACAEIGEAVGGSITFTESNIGSFSLPAGTSPCGAIFETTCSTVGFYVSSDAVITTGDTLLTGGRENLFSVLGAGVPFNPGDSVSNFLFSGASITAGSPTGNVYIGVIVDEQAQVTESSESDNTASQPILIVAAGSGGCGAPDLIVDSMTHQPANPTTEDNIEFTAVVKNIGAVAAGASTLSFKIGGESPSNPSALFSVPSLAPGATATFVRNLTLGVAQNYLNTAVADFNGDVAESNEGNNTLTDSYTVTEPDEPPITQGQTFRILSLPTNGTLFDSLGTQITGVPTFLPDANVMYTPNTGFAGVDDFTYQIEEAGMLSNIGTGFVSVSGLTCVSCVNVVVEFQGAGEGSVKPSPDPQGSDVVCIDDCVLQFPANATVKLQARPNDGGNSFVQWTGACASAGSDDVAELSLPSSGTQTCTAEFAPIP